MPDNPPQSLDQSGRMPDTQDMAPTTTPEITIERNTFATGSGFDAFVAFAWVVDDVTGRDDTRTGYGATADAAKADLIDALWEEGII